MAGLTKRKPSGGSSPRPEDLIALSRGCKTGSYASRPRRSSSVGFSSGISRPRRPRLPGRAEHELAFRADCDEHGIVFNARGCETSYQALRTAVLRGFGCGSAQYRTTNTERAAAMRNAGRARCERTMQRHHRRLQRMGLLMVGHVHRGRGAAGFRDCLHLRLVQSYVTPPKGPEEGPFGPTPPLVPERHLIAPAAPADDVPPPTSGGGEGSDEEQDGGELSAWEQQMLATLSLPVDHPSRQAARAAREAAERERRAARWRSDD